MAGMQRFVTYIYAYDEGRKGGNAGYAKIETRGGAGRIEIHFMDTGAVRGAGKVSFAFFEEGRIALIPIGELLLERGNGMKSFSFGTENVLETGFSFDKIDGISILDSNQKRYLGFWHDLKTEEFGEELFYTYTKQEKKEQTPKMQQESMQGISQEAVEDAEQESLHTMEIPVQNVFPDYDMADMWEQWRARKEQVLYGDEVEAVHIELKDLRELPKKYWYLGNNSFLLHGFFNYHYLVLGKLPDGRWFLGVPGVYQRQERVMASIFGFPGFFLTSKDAVLQTASCEEMKEYRSGLWYHVLEE